MLLLVTLCQRVERFLRIAHVDATYGVVLEHSIDATTKSAVNVVAKTVNQCMDIAAQGTSYVDKFA